MSVQKCLDLVDRCERMLSDPSRRMQMTPSHIKTVREMLNNIRRNIEEQPELAIVLLSTCIDDTK